MNHMSFRERIKAPTDLATMTNAERECYVRGLEAGATQLAAGLDIDRLTIIAALREQDKIIRALPSEPSDAALLKPAARVSPCICGLSSPIK